MSAVPTPRRRVPTPPRPRATPPRSALLPVVDETSAGGLVVRVEDGQAYTAVIARRNRGGRLEWCLPKGHLEGSETPAEAAVREIFEETGIKSQIVQPLGTIDYWFSSTTHRIHKVVHHFLLRALGGELTTEHDPDGEAEQVAWVSLSQLPYRLVYPNERRLARLAAELWTTT